MRIKIKEVEMACNCQERIPGIRALFMCCECIDNITTNMDNHTTHSANHTPISADIVISARHFANSS